MSTSRASHGAGAPPSRPTTPLRASSRTSLRSPRTPSQSGASGAPSGAAVAPELAALEPAFAELADSMADLEANMMHLQLMHESLARFGENFAAFLYGLNVNAFCVDFPEGPAEGSWARHEARQRAAEDAEEGGAGHAAGAGGYDPEQTFMTTDTSFVEHPPASTQRSASARLAASAGSAGRSKKIPPRPSGIARGASGIARGVPRGGASVAAGGRGGPVVRGTRASGLARASAAAKARGRS